MEKEMCCNQNCSQGRDCPVRIAAREEAARTARQLATSDDLLKLANLTPPLHPVDLIARVTRKVAEAIRGLGAPDTKETTAP